MKKLEIERMQRLDEIVDRQTDQIGKLQYLLDQSNIKNIKLQGANEVLKEIVIAGQPQAIPLSDQPYMEIELREILEAKRLYRLGDKIGAIKHLRSSSRNARMSLKLAKDLAESWED